MVRMPGTRPRTEAPGGAPSSQSTTRTDTPPSIEVRCGECQQPLDEPSSLPDESDSLVQTAGRLGACIKSHLLKHWRCTTLRLRSKQPGKGGWIRNFRTGDDYTRYLEGAVRAFWI